MKIECLEIFKIVSEESKREWDKLNNGQKVVANAYIYLDRSKDSLVDLLVIDHAWAEEIQPMLDYMKELNIKSFVFADTSTEAFKSIQILLANNCKLSNIDYKIQAPIFHHELATKVSGILVEI